MAKMMKRVLALCMVLLLSISMFASPAMAMRNEEGNQHQEEKFEGGRPNETKPVETKPEETQAEESKSEKNNENNSTSKEYIVINVNGSHLKTISGNAGDHTWLVQGTYNYSYSMSGTVLSYTVGKQSGSVTIPMPAGFEGCTPADVSATCTWGGGTNSQNEKYDNAIINVTFTKVVTPGGDIVDITDPTEPEATEPVVTEPEATEPVVTEPEVTEPVPVATKVTVNHIYKTYDVYTGETTEDGRTGNTYDATEDDTFTASLITTYGGNTYEMISVDPAQSIIVEADAAKNVITITYLRMIDTTPINYTPVLDIVKTADKAVYEAGETITWTITVKNVSSYTAYNVVIVDELTGDTWTIAELAPGAEKTFTATTENAQSGSIKNVVVASWTDGDEIPDEDEPNETKKTSDNEIVSVDDPAPENYTPVLKVIKTADKSVYKKGETITWTITVKNVSSYTAYNVVIVDELAKGYWTIAELAPGAEKTFTVTMENAAPGSVKNVVVVSWEDGDEIPDEDEPNESTETSDDEIVEVEEPVNYAPVLSIIKTANKKVYKLGQTIKWTITVKNISTYTAYNVIVVDELTGDTWIIRELAPGAEKIFTATSKASKTGSIENVVVVSWEDGDEIPTAEEPDEIKNAQDDETVTVNKPTDPDKPQDSDPGQPENPGEPATADGEIEIIDEEVPLADAPKTGDVSFLWIALSGLSAGGLVVTGKKRKDEE